MPLFSSYLLNLPNLQRIKLNKLATSPIFIRPQSL